MRSLAVILPLACCFAIAASPAAVTASWYRSRRSARRPAVVERSGVSPVVTRSPYRRSGAGPLEDPHGSGP